MKRVLLDENIPIALRRLLKTYEARHVHDLGWAGLSNGRLIATAEQAGFDMMITADQSLRYQQNLKGSRLALVVLNSNNWPLIRRHVDAITAALLRAEPGKVEEVVFGESPA